ncbi:MAG TPA: hypothetical protein VD764_11470 [Nocardioides sp.]|nr:hypothetical protein [Nocardioides sp.]
MKRTPIRLLVLAVASALAAVVLPATAQAAPYCGITWGSTAEHAGRSAPASLGDELRRARAGRHDCYDRLVLDVSGTTAVNSWRVEYVSSVKADGSGALVPLRGGAFLQITVGANNHFYAPANRREMADVAGFRTFRQVASAGGFEGYSSAGLGVRARLPFRVMTLAGPGNTVRVVIDVAHAW